ncbi:MAG TPA: trypsin-like peptidase domain-containing protein, partial [Pyrinomonadaceae bacterium]|nr:trypsin-like peptidase domain-containing protein [Pyrinomonadaceae bacterium]
ESVETVGGGVVGDGHTSDTFKPVASHAMRATSTRAAFEGCSIVSWYGETVARGWSGRNVTEMQTIKNSGPGRLIQVALSLLVLSVCGLNTESDGQQLRDAFHSVQQAVVIVRTQQQGLAPYPQQGLVSLNGLGSGVLISNDGKVLTAAHLVQSADRTMVEFSQGELVPATVVGTVFSADVALLQLERVPVDYVAAKLGDSNNIDVGDEIFVVGAPYGISSTLTAGHVSGRRILKRTENLGAVEFLQTDAAINSGNSGSPVFNLKGEVMGIVSNIMTQSGGSEGLAFAATSNTTRRLLLDQKPIWTGIEGVLIGGKLAKALNLTQSAGILVQRVAEGSLAWRWGIRGGMLRAVVEGEEVILGGDLILSVNGVSVKNQESYDEIYRSIGSVKPGNNLVIDVLRQGQLVSLCIPPSELNQTVSAAQRR